VDRLAVENERKMQRRVTLFFFFSFFFFFFKKKEKMQRTRRTFLFRFEMWSIDNRKSNVHLA